MEVRNGEMVKAFVYLISILCSSSVLCLPRDDEELTLHMAASGTGIGEVLSTIRDGEEHPVGNFSRRLSKAERNYAVSEFECLALVRAVDHFAIHLVGCPFKVITDHKASQPFTHCPSLMADHMVVTNTPGF